MTTMFSVAEKALQEAEESPAFRLTRETQSTAKLKIKAKRPQVKLKGRFTSLKIAEERNVKLKSAMIYVKKRNYYKF